MVGERVRHKGSLSQTLERGSCHFLPYYEKRKLDSMTTGEINGRRIAMNEHQRTQTENGWISQRQNTTQSAIERTSHVQGDKWIL